MKALGSAILIKPDNPPERSASGKLIIPKTTKELLPQWGTIIQCGPACKEVKIGDHVNFPRKSASVQTIEGVDHYWTTEHKLFYIREKEAQK